MKNASGKRHPGEKHSPGEETNRAQKYNEAWRKQRKKMILTLLRRSESQKSAKIRQTVSHCSNFNFKM